MHPFQNPAYAQNERDHEEIRDYNRDPHAVRLYGKLKLPKMVNKYAPHQGAREIARRQRQEARHGA